MLEYRYIERGLLKQNLLFAKTGWATYYQSRLYGVRSAPLFSKLGILDFYRNTFQIAKFRYCYHNNLLPPLLFNLFLKKSQIHSYSTRTANNYRVHHCRTNLKKFPVLYRGPQIWNFLLFLVEFSQF